MWDEPPSLSQPSRLSDVSQGLADITAGDAGFDRSVFMDQARSAFFAVKQAIEAGELSPVAGRLGGGVLATLQGQVERLTEEHAIHHFEDLAIDGMAISRAGHGPEFDHVTVRFDARAAEYAVDEQSRRLVFGDEAVKPFIEYWTFSRQAGAGSASPAAPPTCPSCGAPIAADAGPTCRYCRATLPARQTFDWIVTAIQDPIDFQP
jgi:predicted lipid-binding transport protein (Tim44 family)